MRNLSLNKSGENPVAGQGCWDERECWTCLNVNGNGTEEGERWKYGFLEKDGRDGVGSAGKGIDTVCTDEY